MAFLPLTHPTLATKRATAGPKISFHTHNNVALITRALGSDEINNTATIMIDTKRKRIKVKVGVGLELSICKSNNKQMTVPASLVNEVIPPGEKKIAIELTEYRGWWIASYGKES